MTTQTAPDRRTVTLTYAVVTTEERSLEAPLTCRSAECGADLTAEDAIHEVDLVYCDYFGGSFVDDAQAEKPTYESSYFDSKNGDGFATVDFRCAQCGTSLVQ